MKRNNLVRGLKPMHPGELLRDVALPAIGKSKTEIAHLLGISRQTLYDIIDEKQPVTPAMALRIGKICGNGPDLWLNLQRRYDLVAAARDVDVSGIPTLAAVERVALRSKPVKPVATRWRQVAEGPAKRRRDRLEAAPPAAIAGLVTGRQ